MSELEPNADGGDEDYEMDDQDEQGDEEHEMMAAYGQEGVIETYKDKYPEEEEKFRGLIVAVYFGMKDYDKPSYSLDFIQESISKISYMVFRNPASLVLGLACLKTQANQISIDKVKLKNITENYGKKYEIDMPDILRYSRRWLLLLS